VICEWKTKALVDSLFTGDIEVESSASTLIFSDSTVITFYTLCWQIETEALLKCIQECLFDTTRQA
jgi:hypothetical protein